MPAWASLAAALLTGCAGLPPTAPATPTPDFLDLPLVVSVDTPDGLIGISRSRGNLKLLEGPRGQQMMTTQHPDMPWVATVYLSSYGGETGRAFNSFVFGNPPPGASRFRLSLGGIGGEVVDGVYLVALPQKDLSPLRLAWQFLDPNGQVIEEGTSVRNEER
jgi:hypothetical protein